jgi:hypothetical protein
MSKSVPVKYLRALRLAGAVALIAAGAVALIGIMSWIYITWLGGSL